MPGSRAGFFTAMTPSERRVVSVISGVAVLRMFGLFALLPVLAMFARDLEGATPLLIGVAVGGYGLTQALLQLPFGALSDRIGRVPVILLGLGLFALGSVLAASSDTILGVIAGRLLQGAGAISATLTALLADGTREAMRTRTMALMGVSIGGAFLLSLVLGPVIASLGGVRLLFWLAAGFAVLAGLLLLAVPAIARPATPRRAAPLAAAFRGDLLRLDAGVFLLHAVLTANFVALPFVLGERFELAMTGHWPVYTGALLLSLVGAVPLILADDRAGKGWTLAVAIALLAAGQLLLWTAGSLVMVVAGLAVFFAGFNFLEAGLPARLSILADESMRGASMGVFSSCQFGGAFVGGIAGGALLGGAGPATVFLVSALLAVGWLGVEWRLPTAVKSAGNA